MSDQDRDNENLHFWNFARRGNGSTDVTFIEMESVAEAYDWYSTGGNTATHEEVLRQLEDRDRILLMIVERLDMIAQLLLATTAARLEAPYGSPEDIANEGSH